jgi:bifunctional non-homologous end joining protein LigD
VVAASTQRLLQPRGSAPTCRARRDRRAGARPQRYDGVYLAERRGGKLVYAGKVEHGFTVEQAKRLKAAASRLSTSRLPIVADRAFPKAPWLKPLLRADVEYRRKTSAGLLRHPSYKGLREELD